jgi:hypothetical protein
MGNVHVHDPHLIEILAPDVPYRMLEGNLFSCHSFSYCGLQIFALENQVSSFPISKCLLASDGS